MAGQEVRVGHQELTRFCAEMLQAVGVPPEDAEQTASIQVEADLRGVYSHGTRAIPRYVRNIRHRSSNPTPDITLRAEGPAYALLDGDFGLGQVVASRAMNLAIEKARTSTVAAVGVQRSSHYGAAAIEAALAHPNIWLGTTRIAFEPEFVRAAVEAVGPERVVFGSNGPSIWPDLALESIHRLELGDEAERLIFGENLARIYGIE